MASTIKRTTWNVFSGTQLTFGPRAVGALSGVIQRRKAKRVFVVTDHVLDRAGVVSLVTRVLRETSAEFTLFNEGEVEPSTNTVEKAAEVAREFEPDLFVAIGGGSNMDLAKACSAIVGHGCDAESLFGFDKVPGPTPTLVCLPTTSGTGSEVSHSAILKNASSGRKDAILSQHIRPDIAIIDPYLTITCPQNVTAESGIDALTHAIEAYLVTNFYSFDEDVSGLPYEGNNPFGDLYAEKAIRLVGEHLQLGFEEPELLAARSGMALAATLAGVAFSNCGVGLAHALQYPIATKCGCSPGVGNGVVLTEVMRYHKLYRLSRLAKIAELLNADWVGMPTEEAADLAIHRVAELRESIGLPGRLRDVGIEEEQLPKLAEIAFSRQRLIDLTPGPPSESDGLAILKKCF